ncbi:DUF3341 domain-containing protein [Chelativorans sp. AA-79]|uniref:DUF3341 domain-containing protein n=1 Tax=Chelativorans sp. AA-79 TaxID=3028735 RepID=UPI0023F985F1|nr:DUF3341 domain-containing protein [Chelativorans sp. AA-79]WEX10565.1 DUF3341 domain-containing protein [Chelativorans sp. AA-79]
MHEPLPRTEPVFGLLAEFDGADDLMSGVRKAHDEGFRRMDAFSPFPIEGLAEALGHRDMRVPWLTLFGGIFGAALGYGMQAYTNLDYPIIVGGRPLIAAPAFMLITFELMVLFAVLFSIGGMLALNRLPRLHHPLFDLEEFHLASNDKFFLLILSNDERFERDRTRAFLASLKPVRIELIEHTEEPV